MNIGVSVPESRKNYHAAAASGSWSRKCAASWMGIANTGVNLARIRVKGGSLVRRLHKSWKDTLG